MTAAVPRWVHAVLAVVLAASANAWRPAGRVALGRSGRTAVMRPAAGLLVGTETSDLAAPLQSPCSSVGMPRVHRFDKDDGSEQWMMWFQGRDDDIEPNVVKLSTGRIYHATSSDGLSWTLSEGTGPRHCAFDVNEDEWWGFDTAHIGLGDIMITSSSVVRTAGGVFVMYYFGGDYSTRAASDFTGASAGSTEGVELTGMELRIGVALSQDGINWSRLEGEHANGAALDIGKDGDFDSTMAGWPQVVALGEGDFRMFYSAMDPNQNGKSTLGMARSKDGFKWRKVGPISLPASTNAEFDGKGVSRRTVIQLPGDENLTMFFEAVGSTGRHSIGLATSADGGMTWTPSPHNPVFEPAEADAWDGKAVGSPEITLMSDDSLRMYYVGTAADGTCRIGCAAASITDLASWTRVE